MTTFTTIPNASLEPGKPIRSIDGLALRDNPVAIAEGASGAPRIADAALGSIVTNAGRDWVLARNAAADVGAVGTYAVLYNNSASNIASNSTVAGGSLGLRTGAIANINHFSTAFSTLSFIGVAQSGTWRCLTSTGGVQVEYTEFGFNYTFYPGLFLRIS